MKRGGALRRNTPLKKKSKSETALFKEDIQAYLRDIVIARDGGCVLRAVKGFELPQCGGYRKDGKMILQADHLVTRSNSATFADSRLVVCICRNHHAWKSLGANARKIRYDAIMKKILPIDRVTLWNKCEAESWKPQKINWKLEHAAIKNEYNLLSKPITYA